MPVAEPSDQGSAPVQAKSGPWSVTALGLRPLHLLLSWIVSAASVLVAAAIVPGVSVPSLGAALVVAVLLAILNATLPPLVAALPLPFTLALGFVLVLLIDAAILLLASQIDPSTIKVSGFGWALLATLIIAAASMVLQAVLGANDDDTYTLRVIRRTAKRHGGATRTDTPGMIFLEIDGLALPVLRRAMRDGNAPFLRSCLDEGTHRLVEWETDFSSQTGASQAGILLGSNEGIPAFRWVEKETGKLMACSSPADCEEIERRCSSGRGLLIDGGASRGNLFSGEADTMILTVSHTELEKHANPGYRAFLANGFNVTRALVLFAWELVLEWRAALQQRRRDIHPRGHRGGKYPLLRAALCVVVRDLIVFGVLSDLMQGRPAVYATFSSYDEVAHHSGLERSDTLEALRKLDEHFARIAHACRYAPRPYKLVVLSDHGQTQGATFKQRNNYDLREFVESLIERGTVPSLGDKDGDENHAKVGHALRDALGRSRAAKRGQDPLADHHVAVLGSGNLGLIYLMEEKRRLSSEEIDARHPRLLAALREHPHVGFLLVRSTEHGAMALGARGTNFLAERRVEGEDPLAPFSPNAPAHLLRSSGFENCPDIMVNSFYDPVRDQGCAFEELISFHGGMGGAQTRAFILYPAEFQLPDQPIVGAGAVHDLLAGWRHALQDDAGSPPEPRPVQTSA